MLVPWRAGKVCNMLVPVDTKANVGLLSFFSANKAKKEGEKHHVRHRAVMQRSSCNVLSE